MPISFILIALVITCCRIIHTYAVEFENNCDCFEGLQSPSHSFNFSCLQECSSLYGGYQTSCTNMSISRCEAFLFTYMLDSSFGDTEREVTESGVVDVFIMPVATAISIKSEIHNRLSFEGRHSYHCTLTIAFFKQEKSSFLRKCFHYNR